VSRSVRHLQQTLPQLQSSLRASHYFWSSLPGIPASMISPA
jgi:hypothetical protein